MYFKTVPLLLPQSEAEGDFSLILTVGACWAHGGKSLKIVWSPYHLAPWSFYTQTCPHWASNEFANLSLVFPLWHCFSRGFLQESDPVSYYSWYSPFGLSDLGVSDFLCFFISLWVTKELLIFHSLSFLLVVKTKWWLQSSSYEEPEIKLAFLLVFLKSCLSAYITHVFLLVIYFSI